MTQEFTKPLLAWLLLCLLLTFGCSKPVADLKNSPSTNESSASSIPSSADEQEPKSTTEEPVDPAEEPLEIPGQVPEENNPPGQEQPATKPTDDAENANPKKLGQVPGPLGYRYVFSSNRKYVACASTKGLTVWNLATKQAKHLNLGHSPGVFSLSSNGQFVVTKQTASEMEGGGVEFAEVMNSGANRLPDVTADNKDQPAENPGNIIPRENNVTYDMFGDTMFESEENDIDAEYQAADFHELVVWNTGANQEVVLKPFRVKNLRLQTISTFAVSSQYIFAAMGPSSSNSRYLVIFDLKDGKVLRVLEGHKRNIRSIVVSPSERFLVTTSDDRMALLWDIEHSRELQIFDKHLASVTSAAFSSDERQLLTGSEDLTAILWDTASGEAIKTIPVATYDPLDAAKQKLAAISRQIDLIADPTTIRSGSRQLNTQIENVDFSPSGKQVLVSLRVGFNKTRTDFNTIHKVNPVILNLPDLSIVDPITFSLDNAPLTLAKPYWPRFFGQDGETAWIPITSTTRIRGEDIVMLNLVETETKPVPIRANPPHAQLALNQVKHRSAPQDSPVLFDAKAKPLAIHGRDNIFEGVLGGARDWPQTKLLSSFPQLKDEDGTEIETKLLRVLIDDEVFARAKTPITVAAKNPERYVGKILFTEAYATTDPYSVGTAGYGRFRRLKGQQTVLEHMFTLSGNLNDVIRHLATNKGNENVPTTILPKIRGIQANNIQRVDSALNVSTDDGMEMGMGMGIDYQPTGQVKQWKIRPVENLGSIGLGFPKTSTTSSNAPRNPFTGESIAEFLKPAKRDEVEDEGIEEMFGGLDDGVNDASTIIGLPIRVIGEVVAVPDPIRNQLMARLKKNPRQPKATIPTHLLIPYAFVIRASHPRARDAGFSRHTRLPATLQGVFKDVVPKKTNRTRKPRRRPDFDGFDDGFGLPTPEGFAEMGMGRIKSQPTYCYVDVSKVDLIRAQLESLEPNRTPQDLAVSIVNLMKQPANSRAEQFLKWCSSAPIGKKAKAFKDLSARADYPVQAFGRTFANRNELLEAIAGVLEKLQPACKDFNILSSDSKVASVTTSGGGKLITWEFVQEKGLWLISNWGEPR